MIYVKKHNKLQAAAMLGLLLMVSVFSHVAQAAQVVGATLSGVVKDVSGAVIPHANLKIRNTGTSETRNVTSNDEGLYVAPNLLPGKYEVMVAAQGFGSVLQQNLVLNVGAEQTFNPVLSVSEVNQTVTVTDAPPSVQSSSSTVSATVEGRTIRELPLNGRDWTSLAVLEPGVVSIPTQVGTGISANKGNRGYGNQLSDAGHRPSENSYRVNGVNTNDYANGAPGGATGINLGVDAIEEFSVLTANYTAEYGRTSGAVINAITKSGTNKFHGSLYFFDRDKIFDAKNFFDAHNKPIPSFRRTQFGASAGGPIVRDRTFIFGDFEAVRQNQAGSQIVTVPSANARKGILCAQAACTSTISVPVDAATARYLPLYPLPASVAGQTSSDTVSFSTASPLIATENYFTVRVDQKINANDSLVGSYFYDSGPQSQSDPLNNMVQEIFSRRQMVGLEETHVFSPTIANTVRVGLNRVRGDIDLPGSAKNPLAGDPSLAIAPGGAATPKITITGLTPILGLGANNRFDHHYTSVQAYDDAFFTLGRHSLKAGFAFERMDYNALEILSPNGVMNYPSLSAFLQNSPAHLSGHAINGSKGVGLRESLFAGYLQDDWRMSSHFTVNAGLRYEMTTIPTEAKNRLQAITSLSDCGASPSACGPVPLKAQYAKNPTLTNFEPRFGFAWDPFGEGKTAVHGAAGVFDSLPLLYVFALNDAAVYPFQIVGSDNAARLTPGTVDPNISFNIHKIRQRYVQQNPKRSVVFNWNLNIQQDLGSGFTATVGYTGSRSVHLPFSSDDINLVPHTQTSAGLLFPCNAANLDPGQGCGSQATGTKVDPNFGGPAGIRPTRFDSSASYESLQTELRKVMSHGVQGQLAYTFGKCIDMGSSPLAGDGYQNSIAVPIWDSKQYRLGPCDFDIRHTLVGTFIWDIPAPKSASRLVSAVAGGWELGSIVSRSSGSPFTATVGGGGDPLGTGFNGDFSMDFASKVPGCNPIHGGVNYLNINCFALPQATPAIASLCQPFGFRTPNPTTGDPGSGGISGSCTNLVGNYGRNSLYGPGLFTTDFSVFKNIPIKAISENFNAQFRLEAFNALNHPNLQAPAFLNPSQNNSLFNPDGSPQSGAGVLNATSTPPRQIQLGLKINW